MENIIKNIILIILSIVCFSPLVAQNTLRNPSFEASDGGGGVRFWQKRPGNWQDSIVFHSGNHSYRMNPGNNQYTFYRIEADSVDVGREYTLSVWTKTEGHNANARAYWRYPHTTGGLQLAPFDMNNLTDTSWTYYQWDFYPKSNRARLDIFWNASAGMFWVDDISMHLKERTVAQIKTLPEPWRLNIGDNDTCTISVELRDTNNLRVSNSSDAVAFVNLDPSILTLVSSPTVNALFGQASAQFIGTANPGIGRIEIQSGNLKDTLWISNRERHTPDDFFHIGTWMLASLNASQNLQWVQDLDSIGMNIVFPINGGTAANLSFLDAIQTAQKDIKVIVQTHLINAPNEHFYPQKNWSAAVAASQRYANLFMPYDSLLYGYHLSDEPNTDANHHDVAFHSNALYAADPERQAITVDAWAIHLTERNMRIRNNDFKLTYLYPFGANTPLGAYPFNYGGIDSETAFDSLSRYDNKPWYHMVQSFTMDLTPAVKRWPKAGEMKLQAYSAISYGAKGIYYFFYHDIPGHPQEIRGLAEEGFPIVHRQLWEPARQINWNIRNNERVFIKGTHSAISSFASSSDPLLRIADFELAEPNGKYIMLVNRNALDTLVAPVNILTAGINFVENKFSTGGEISSFLAGVAQVKIHPGDAMLLHLQNTALAITDKKDFQNKVQLFPNPTSKYLTIKQKFPDRGSIKIFDVAGKLLYDDLISSTIKQIDVSNFPKGVYILSLKTEEDLRQLKFVKLW